MDRNKALMPPPAQSFSVKRAEVEFHNFASLGEPERAIATYAEENQRRGAVIRNHLDFIGEMSPFLESDRTWATPVTCWPTSSAHRASRSISRPIPCATALRSSTTGR